MSNRMIGGGLVVISSLFYASYGVWTTLMGDFFGGYTASAFRSIVVVSILIPIALFFRQLQPLHIRKNFLIIFGMILFATLIWGPLYFAILEIGVALSLTVNYATMVIGYLFFGWLFTGERLTKTKIISGAVGIVGLLLVFFPSFAGMVSFVGLVAASFSGFFAAANMVLAKKLPYNVTQSSLIVWITSIVANIPLAFVLREPVPLFDLHIEWLYLVLFALSSIFSTWLLLAGMKYIDAGSAGIIGLLEIVFGVLFGVFLFGEMLQPTALIGIVLIIAASAYPYYVADDTCQ